MTTLAGNRPARRPSEIGHVETNLGDTADAFVQALLRYKSRNGDSWGVDVPANGLEQQIRKLLAGTAYLECLEAAGRQNISLNYALLNIVFIMAEAGYLTIEGEVDWLKTTDAFERLCNA